MSANSLQGPLRTHWGYRPEVDGLRAVAVLPVMLFHAGFGWFKGGYVGVDVFFVISGYLITSIIVAERAAGKFSIVAFYERRARRILPALCLVMFTCIPFAWLWMMPDQLLQFAQSLAAVMLFSSNLLFWRSSGYFEPAAEEKPLLHTWSLGVEEQYYLVFPLFVMFAWRLGLRRMSWLLAALALASLGLSEWGWRTAPSANFFVAPTRAWEILIGSLLAILLGEYQGFASLPSRAKQLLSGLGFALIAGAVLLYDDLTPFPSVYGLVPTLGTALLIGFATPDTLVGRLLCQRWMVGIGLISYSAYLWHQPLFAFARLRSFGEPSRAVFAVLCVATLVLAYLSWRFIEAPFRDRKRMPRGAVFAFAGVTMASFIALGAFGHTMDGFRNYQRERALAEGYVVFDVEGELKHRKAMLEASESRLTAPFHAGATTKILLVGDSHSNDLALAYLTNADAFDVGYQMRRIEFDETCFERETPSAATKRCVEGRQRLFQSGLIEAADYVLVVVRWTAHDVRRIAPLKEQLGISGDKLVLVGRTAEFCDVPSLLARAVKTAGKESLAELEHTLAHYRVTSLDAINHAVKAEAARLGLRYLDKKDLICREDRCAFLDERHFPYYFDYGHWSLVGAKHFGESILTSHWLPVSKRGGA
ncbi:MAG: acyltransferase family protein [Myxococcota bacterium]